MDQSLPQETELEKIKIEDKKKEPVSFDEFGNTVETITKDLDQYTYIQPKPNLPEEKKTITIPGEIRIQADGFYRLGKLGDRIYKKATDQPVPEIEPENSFTIFETGAAGIIDGTLKTLRGGYTLTGELIDALRDEGLPVDKGLAAKLEKQFNDSVLGKIQKGAEEIAFTDGVGRIMSGFTQLYTAGRAFGGVSLKLAQKAKDITNNYITAAKTNRLIVPNKNITKAIQKAKSLNQLTTTQKFIAVGVGGGLGAGLVVDTEDIGVLGEVPILQELFGNRLPVLDRDQKEDAQDDATRKLLNRFKVGTEQGLISIPFAYGLGALSKKLATQGDSLATSDSKLDRWIDKYVRAPFQPRGKKPEVMFEAMKRTEGEIAVAAITAKDLILDIDKSLFRIVKDTGLSGKSTEIQKIIGKMDEILMTGDDVVRNGKIQFKGFTADTISQFKNYVDELGLSSAQADDLLSNIINVRNQFNVFKNGLLNSDNVLIGSKEFNEIMTDRIRRLFNSEYRILTDKGIFPWNNYKPTKDNIESVKQVIDRYARSNNTKLTESQLEDIVGDILKNVRMNEITKTPEFFLTKTSLLNDAETQLINIADNVVGQKFKPTDLIKTKADLKSFERLFGLKRDIRNSIINVTNDLATLVAKDKFYSNILNVNDDLIKEGKTGIIYPTRLQAVNSGLKYDDIITNKNGLQIKSPLGDEVYSNPLNGKFTSKTLSDALNFSEEILFDELLKKAWYSHFLLMPKGLVQISKTTLSPITHARNFTANTVFTIGLGNAFKDPRKIYSNFIQAFNTIQPQLAYRNSPQNQALYKFLRERNVTASSISQQEISGILDDINKGGDVYQKFFTRFGKVPKKIYDVMGDMYIAEDDIWKVYNYLSEFDNYKSAYQAALKLGKIKSMPSDLEIANKAAEVTNKVLPNYNYVGDFFKSLRRIPFIGNFISWPVSVIRSGYNTAELALKEMSDPILRNLGVKRAVFFGGTTTVAVPTISEILRNLYGITKDQVAAIRQFVPSYSKDDIIFAYKDSEGKLKYADASNAFVYDTFTQPFTTVIANVENQRVFNPNDPLMVGLFNGAVKSVGKFLAPFIDNAIFYDTVISLWLRNGVTKEGVKIWNPEDSLGDKVAKGAAWGIEQVAPFSYAGLDRLQKAIREVPGKRGEKYDVSDELAGFYGLRGIPIDPIKSMDYKIAEFKQRIRNSRSIFTGGELQRGGEISNQQIIDAYIKANARKFEIMKQQKNVIEAAKLLGASTKDLGIKYDERDEGKIFDFMNANKFDPINITERTEEKILEKRKELEQNFSNLKFEAPLNREVDRILGTLIRDMSRIPLDGKFYDYINRDNYLTGEGRSEAPTNVAPLPEQPMPSQQIVERPVSLNINQQGLTPTEAALLTPSEQQMRLRQRGLL